MVNKKLTGILLISVIFILSAILFNTNFVSADYSVNCQGEDCGAAACTNYPRQVLLMASDYGYSTQDGDRVHKIAFLTGVASRDGWTDKVNCIATEVIEQEETHDHYNYHGTDYNGDYNHDNYYNEDNQAPRVTNVQTDNLEESSVTLTWNTNERADSEIDYGRTRSLGLSKLSDTLTQYHSVRLTGLQSDTTYYFRITSCDYNNNCQIEGTFSFRTLESSDCNNNYNNCNDNCDNCDNCRNNDCNNHEDCNRNNHDYNCYNNNCNNDNSCNNNENNNNNECSGNSCHKTQSSTSKNTIDELSLYYLLQQQQANNQKVIVVPQTSTQASSTTQSTTTSLSFNGWYLLAILLIVLIVVFVILIVRVITKQN